MNCVQALAWVLTLASELCAVWLVVLLVQRRRHKAFKSIKLNVATIAALVASGLSHPMAWHVYMRAPLESVGLSWAWWAGIEIAVVCFEACVYYLLFSRFAQLRSWGLALSLSFFANLVSALLGLVLIGDWMASLCTE